MKDQIAAEAAEQFRQMVVERHRWDADSPVCGQLRKIIQSAIEKGIQAWLDEKAAACLPPPDESPPRSSRVAHSLPAEARASEQVVVVGCKITDVSSRVCEHGQKSCEIRHASEPPQSRGEQGEDAAKARGLDLNHVDGFYYAMGYDAALSQRPTPYTADEHDKTCICMYCKPEIWPDDSEENKYRDLAAERWNQLEAAKEDTKLAQEIFEESAVESRLTKYVVVQITTSTWEKLQSRFAAMKREEA